MKTCVCEHAYLQHARVASAEGSETSWTLYVALGSDAIVSTHSVTSWTLYVALGSDAFVCNQSVTSWILYVAPGSVALVTP